jgi:hypothetical protein
VRRLFALDQNFPAPIVKVLERYQTDVELVRLPEIDRRLGALDDWEVLLALHLHERQWDGLITTDTSMLNQPLELSVLIQIGLTLVAIREAGHNPVKASGLLFAYLPGICQRTEVGKAQLWTPAAANRLATEPWDALKRVAEHQHTDATTLFNDHQLDPIRLSRDPLAL